MDRDRLDTFLAERSGPEFFSHAARAIGRACGARWAGISWRPGDGRGSAPHPPLTFIDLEQPQVPEDFEHWLNSQRSLWDWRGSGDEPVLFDLPESASEFTGLPGTKALLRRALEDHTGRRIGQLFALFEDSEDALDRWNRPEIGRAFAMIARRVETEFQKRKLEASLRAPAPNSLEALRRYERMVEAFTDSIVFIDRDGIIRTFNSEFVQFLNRTQEEIQDRHVREIVGEEHYQRILEPRLQRCGAGEELHVQSWVYLPRLGSRFLDARYYPYRAADGHVTGIVASIRDITQAKKHQAKLVELQTDDAVVTGDLDHAVRKVAEVVADTLTLARLGIWLFENDLAELRCVHVFERASRQHSGGPVLSVDHHPGFFQCLSDAWTLEVDDTRHDPRTRELSKTYLEKHDVIALLSAPIRIGGEIVGMVSHEHVGSPRTWQAEEAIVAGEAANLIAQTMMGHNRRDLEERLRQAHKMESLGLMAGGIAHDFNNLLVGIIGGADLTLPHLEDNHPARRSIEMISESASHAAELCTQLMAYAGKGRYVRQARDLSKVVHSTVRLLEPSISSSIRVDLQLESSLPASEIDATQIRQVVTHLLTNAAEAIAENPGTITLTTGLCQQMTDPHLLTEPGKGPFIYFEITDTGCGMDAETQTRMFDPFFTTKFTGRGLGLAATLGIVRGHGGAMHIKSALNEGTRIRVFFPATDKLPKPETAEIEALRNRSHGQSLILVVDDEEMVRRIAQCILEKNGFRVLTAKNGLEGLNLFRNHAEEIDAVLLDIKMPVMDGEEMFREIRQINKQVNVVLSSGFSEESANRQFRGLNRFGFLKKPYRAESLIDKIRASIGQTLS